MKIQTLSNSKMARLNQRGMGAFELLFLVVGAWLAYSVVSGGWNHLTAGGWDHERLEQVAAKMVRTANYAQQAGVKLVDPSDLEVTIQRLAEGETAKSGPFAGQFYGVRDLDEKGRERVKDFLKIEDGTLAMTTEVDRRWN